MSSSSEDASSCVSYESDIKPLFRPKDRNNMISFFDLWSYDDVKQNAPAIHARVSNGSMPCDSPWPTERVNLFGTWMEQGMAP